jgi:hypothetical protein
MRFILYGIILWLAIGIIEWIISSFIPISIEPIIALILNGVVVYFYIALIYKREHDRNLDGKNKAILISASTWLIYVIQFVLSMLLIMKPEVLVSNTSLLSVVSMISWALAILTIIFVRPLVFRRGTTWPNQYGTDPITKK